MANEHATAQSTSFPPVVAVLGHVDHGKTTLLDAIRQTSIADREFGGITQKIGASVIEIEHDGQKRRITFIDTPGHEAFSKMRGRGAQAADIGLLIVSAVDGVMPQTRESSKLLMDAKIPYIVVLTKADLPTKNIEKVKQQVLHEGILLEGYGGDVPVIEVAAKTKHNVKELLDLILLVNEMQQAALGPDAQPSASAPLNAIVIESKLDARSGSRATVIIKQGTMKVREEYAFEGNVFRLRMITNSQGKQMTEATVGEAVEIIGMDKVPSVGSLMMPAGAASEQVRPVVPQKPDTMKELVYFRPEEDNKQGLSLILCADTEGALEAITYGIPEGVKIFAKKTGEVTEGDVLMAKSTGSIVLGFNIKIRPEVAKFAFIEKILVKNYNILYEMLDEISDVLEGKRIAAIEQILGQAKVLAKFPFEKTWALGLKVTDGRVARGDKVRLMRGEEVVGETTIKSLRIAKEAVSKVEKGQEAGIVLTSSLDFQVGDVLISLAS